MKKTKTPTSIFLFTICLFYFLTPKLCFHGAKSGCELWLTTIIPALLPMCILSNFIISANLTKPLCELLSPIFCPLFGVSKQSCYVILIGLLSGFPIGAKTCNDLLKKNVISLCEAQYLLSFVNNASPMFLLIYIPNTIFFGHLPHFTPYFIILLSSILCSIVYRFFYINPCFHSKISDQTITSDDPTPDTSFINTFDEAVISSFRTLAKIGGYIIVFSIFFNMLLVLPCPSFISLLLGSNLEMTSGIQNISNSLLPDKIKIILTMICATSGGLSSLFQTRSVIAGSGLSFQRYCVCKLTQTIFVLIFTYILIIT